MQGDSTPLLASDHVATTATRVLPHDGGDADASRAGETAAAGGSNSGEERAANIVDEAEHMSYGSNRWPRQETLALLKIRSDMDEVFRDSNLKGPLWEEVSRKLGELRYHRSAKKCKEKFENVYKYHKRTKDGRTGKSQGKTYRFFDQLEAFETHQQSQFPAAKPPVPKSQPVTMTITTAASAAASAVTLPWINPPNITHATLPSSTNHPVIITPADDAAIDPMPLSSSQPLNPSHQNIIFAAPFQNFTSHLFSSSTSSSTASDEEFQGNRKRKRRYWKDFFERLTKQIIRKQEELQMKFLEAAEKREKERIAREEAWRVQEMARINKEHEMLIQERTTAAAKDAAVIAMLQKISGDHHNSIQIPNIPSFLITQPPQPTPPALTPIPVTVTHPRPLPSPMKLDSSRKDNGQDDNATMTSSSRWPKIEVEALIRLRTSLETKYQENGPKGPLWEDISSEMKKLGYNRSSKRCKEKWENINKYFKKVKESSKKVRSQDSKTCPYYHHLEALYKEKSMSITHNITTMVPLPQVQQWPPLYQQQHVEEATGKESIDRNIKEDDDINNTEEEEEEEEEGEEAEEEGDEGSYQVVASKEQASS